MIRIKTSHQKFAALNREQWGELRQGKGCVLININGIPQHTVMAGVAARLLNQAKGLQPLGLISGCTKNRDDVREVLESFGVRTFLRLSRNPLTRPISLIKAMIHTTRAWWHIRQRGFEDFIEHFQVHGIHIGDMIYDSFIRYDHTYQAPHHAASKLRKVLLDALWTFFSCESLLRRHPVRFVIMSESVYAISEAFLMRIAASRGVPTLFVNSSGFAKMYSDYEDTFDAPFKISMETLEQSRQHKNRIEIVDAYLQRRSAGKLVHHDVINAYRDKQVWTRDALIDHYSIAADEKRKFIFLMPHCFSDTNHQTRYVLFRDFYQWFRKTLELIEEVDSVLWFVKPHPSGFFYREEGQVEELVARLKGDHIFLTSQDFSTASVLNVADGVVTVNGSIGLEAACAGVRPLLSAAAVYSGLGFTELPKSREAYFNTLRQMGDWTPLDAGAVRIAREVMYCGQFYTCPVSAIIPGGSVRPGGPPEEFKKFYDGVYDSITENLREMRFEDDPYVQNLESLLERGRGTIRQRDPVTVDAIM
jgi:hypothetical protein